MHNDQGETVHVLDLDDLTEAKNSLIRWLLFTAVPFAVIVGISYANAQAKNMRQDERLTQHEESLARQAQQSRTLDSLLIETRHLTDEVRAVNRIVAKAVR